MRSKARPIRFPAIAAALALAVMPAAQAAEVTVSNAWIRAMPSSVPSGGYFTLHNGGSREVILTGAQSPACGMLMLHRSSDMGGMSAMQDVTDVKVPAGGSVTFAPGGYHLMCMDVTSALKKGGSVPVTLVFRGGARLTANFAVRGATGK